MDIHNLDPQLGLGHCVFDAGDYHGAVASGISSMKSSLRMQRIQPQMKSIQEKYKRYSLTDPRRADMQKEMQALYKKEGVNPVGGCFPLLLQMPFCTPFTPC